MRILLESDNKKNYIATTAIGGNYYKDWFEYAYPSWQLYCKAHGIGIIVADEDLIEKDNPIYKGGIWHRYLIGDVIIKDNLDIKNICYIDTDFLLNPIAPNVFDIYDEEKIAVVSTKINLPYSNLDFVKRKLAFNRHTFYSNDYPLDSALFISNKDLWELHQLPEQKEYFCSGLIVFNVKNHSQFLKDCYFKYSV